MSTNGQSEKSGDGALVDEVTDLARRWRRPDIADVLHKARALSSDPVANVVVVGESNRGKSRFVNALVGARVCPVDADVASNCFVSLDHSSARSAQIFGPEWPEGLSVPVEDLPTWASEQENPGNARQVERVQVGIPSDLLAAGMRLIDTPGVGGLNAAHRQVSLATLAWADALIFVLDPEAPISRPERDFLALASERIGSVIFVLTKIDLYMDWETIQLENQRLIASHAARFADAPLLPVSSVDKEDADAADDQELREASGFGVLERLLREHVVGRAIRLRVWSLAQAVRTALDQLEAPEQLTLQTADRGSFEAAAARVREAADEHAKSTRSWSSALSSVYQRDVAHPSQLELRRRLRALSADYEQRIASNSPEPDSLGQQLDAELRGLALELRAMVAERSQSVLEQLARTYKLDFSDQVRPEFLDEPIELVALEEDQSPQSAKGLSRRFLGANSIARHSLYGHQFFLGLGPIGWAAGATLGSAILIASLFTQRTARSQQEARSVLKRATEIARVELDADLRACVLDARQFVQTELQVLIEQRKAQLDAEVKRCERAVRQDEKERKAARALARERLKDIAVLRTRADELYQLAQHPPTRISSGSRDIGNPG